MVSLAIEVVDSTAVAHHNTLIVPLVAQDLYQQTVASAARIALVTVVGAHHLFYATFGNQVLESREVGLVEVARIGEVGIIHVTVPFRTRVNSKVLGTSVGLIVLRISWSLQATHYCQTHRTSEVGVFAVGLLTTSPTWITEDVDVWGPECKSLIAFYIA